MSEVIEVTIETPDTLNVEMGQTMVQTNEGISDVLVDGQSVVVNHIANITSPTVPTKISQLQNDSGYLDEDDIEDMATQTWVENKGYLTSHQSLTNYPTKPEVTSQIVAYHDAAKQDKLTAGDNITIDANNKISANVNAAVNDVQVDGVSVVSGGVANITGKQDTISDLSTIRAGAAQGASAVQPAAISDMATKTWVEEQDYVDTDDIADFVTDSEMAAAIAAHHDSSKQEKLIAGPNITIVGNVIAASQDQAITDVTQNGVSVVANKVANITTPTKLSELTNDTNYATAAQVTAAVTAHHDTTKQDTLTAGTNITIVGNVISATGGGTGAVDDVRVNGTTVVINGIAYVVVPTKTSDLTNDSDFVSKSVDDLTNYYLKSNLYTKTEVNSLIAAIKQFTYEIVSVLPTASAATMNKIYLVPNPQGTTQNIKDEYITLLVSGEYIWEKIGTTAVDLSNYYNKTEVDALLADKVDAVSGKGLSTNDYTTAEKALVAAAIQPNDNVSELINDAGYLTEHQSLANYSTTAEMNSAIAAHHDSTKQDTLTAGTNIQINGSTISATDTTYVAGTGITIQNNVISVDGDLGKVDDVKVNGTSVVSNKVANVTVPTKTSDITNDSGFITNTVSNLTNYRTASAQDAIDLGITNSIGTINAKIPSAATSENQLADKAFVNSSISTETATFRGTSAQNLTEEQFLAWANSLTKTNNDYVFWDTTDSDGNRIFKRYKYNGTSWLYEYSLNNSSFTSTQWAAINSGITTSLVTDIGNNTSARHTHSNKSLLDTYTQTEVDLADAVDKKHTHDNKSALDTITSAKISAWDAKQDALPTVTNDRYLHTNSSTGALEWSEAGKVDDVKVNGASVVTSKVANVTVPTKTSDITNDSGFITNSYHDSTKEDAGKITISGTAYTASKHTLSWTNNGTTYSYEVVTV